ncbi:kxDL motif-containing protein 1 isoform X1 [Erinaceus europaeus]|uniref:KxDL motif-containing protein 1 n=1 Tax=Erinaceus europaeus TaxID=9365 RepID=A0ABM3WP87_ERIEU|nr:kxDL motif-containing protein 1 isoform X1 [Erinaceus europaeus]
MEPADSASRAFCSHMLSMVNEEDVNAIILAQKNMLDRFEKTNQMLLNFNGLAGARLQHMAERLGQHTRALLDMKRDLDSVFRRIRLVSPECSQARTPSPSLSPHRTLKSKLSRQHPEAFSYIPEASFLEEEDEDAVAPSTTTTIATSEQSSGSCATSPDALSPCPSPGAEGTPPRPPSPALNGCSSPGHRDGGESPSD